LVAALEQFSALAGAFGKGLQAGAVGAQLQAEQQLAACPAVMVELRQQWLLLFQDALQAAQVAFAEGLVFLIDQFEQLLGTADIVVEKLKQGGVVHRKLSDIGRP
jgi:hypothetical protein